MGWKEMIMVGRALWWGDACGELLLQSIDSPPLNLNGIRLMITSHIRVLMSTVKPLLNPDWHCKSRIDIWWYILFITHAEVCCNLDERINQSKEATIIHFTVIMVEHEKVLLPFYLYIDLCKNWLDPLDQNMIKLSRCIPAPRVPFSIPFLLVHTNTTPLTAQPSHKQKHTKTYKRTHTNTVSPDDVDLTEWRTCPLDIHIFGGADDWQKAQLKMHLTR